MKTLRSKLIIIFLGTFVLVLTLCLLSNSYFLPKYYEQSRTHSLVSMFGNLEESLADEERTMDLRRECQAENISLFVSGLSGEMVFSTSAEEGILKNRLLGHLLNDRETGDKILETNSDYQLLRTIDPATQTDFLELWGFSDNYAVVMRTPLESIMESARTANLVLLYISICGLILGLLLILIATNQVTKPIRQLTDLSDRMATLDFDAKYEGETYDEIGTLGENYNRMSESLENAIADLKSANLKLQKDLENREKQEQMRSEFIANVSHELKTPIALIKGYAEGLQTRMGEDPEIRADYCSIINDETDKMNHLVQNLLHLNELEYGQRDLELERFDLRELASAVLTANRLSIEENGITVENRIPEKCHVWGDVFRIEQVLTNYITNAIHYASGKKQIILDAEADEKKVRVTVFNTGNQIPEEDLGRLWEKFYKVDKARTREYGGNGIGLSIVKAIMEAHGGAYGVYNTDGGVTFWFELNCD